MIRVSVVGCGRVGSTLGYLFSRCPGYEVGDIFSRTVSSVSALKALVPSARACNRIEEIGVSDIYLLTMTDSAIIDTAESYALALPLRSGDLVLHWSGALSSESLGPYRERGADIGSIHPVKSFSDPVAAAETFSGTWCGVEGEDLKRLHEVVRAIGGIPFDIPTEHKLLYHAAAVFSCNYVVALFDIGVQCLMRIGIEREIAQKILLPLLKGTYENLTRARPEDALTGPIARGDLQLVERQHAHVSSHSEELGELYRILGEATARMKGREEIEALLKEQGL